MHILLCQLLVTDCYFHKVSLIQNIFDLNINKYNFNIFLFITQFFMNILTLNITKSSNQFGKNTLK